MASGMRGTISCKARPLERLLSSLSREWPARQDRAGLEQQALPSLAGIPRREPEACKVQ